MADEVRADTAELRRFVVAGERYVFRLQAILDAVGARRSWAVATLSHQAGRESSPSFEELIAEAATNNRLVEAIAEALARHDAAGPAASAPAATIDRALADAGLALTGRDLPLAQDQLLANRLSGGPVGDDALEILGRWMQDNDVHLLEFGAFEVMALTGANPGQGTRADLPPEVLQAAQYLYRNPDLYLAVAVMSGSTNPLGVAGISVDDLVATLQVNRGLRVLSDQRVFEAVDADGDGHVTYGEISAAEGALPAAELDRLQGLNHLGWDPLRTLRNGNAPIIRLAALAESRGIDGSPDLTGTFEDGLSYHDVVGATVNLHSFANDPAGAYGFVTQLPTSFDDLSGLTSGFDTRLVDDGGLRATAAAALAGAPGFLEQNLVVAHLPESQGGVRNLLITTYYAELAFRLNERMNGHLTDPLDPTIEGHSGVVWPVMAPFASNGVRPVITGDLTVAGVLHPSQGDRQAAADGNQYIFGTIGPAVAAFLEAFPQGRPMTEEAVEKFFDGTSFPHDREAKVFLPGQADLRDGFVYFAAALDETDPVRRQELVFTGNLLLATYEQGGAQNWIERLTDLDLDDDGWRAALQAGSWFFGGDEAIATDQMRLPVGIPTGEQRDDSEIFRMALDVPRRPGDNNELIGSPLIDFDPTDPDAQEVAFPAFTVGLDGAPGDVVTDVLQGWDDPPAGSTMETLPTSVVDWAAEGQSNYVVAGEHVVLEEGGSGDGTDLDGTAAIRWSDWEDRQWYIANLFHQFHTDPALYANLADYGPGRIDVQGEESLAEFLPPEVLAELFGGGA